MSGWKSFVLASFSGLLRHVRNREETIYFKSPCPTTITTIIFTYNEKFELGKKT